MRIHRDIPIPKDARGASVALGNFDGVHLGHQAILRQAQASADAPLGVLTFEPHPRQVFRPEDAPFRLMNSDAKAHRLEKLGVSQLYEIAFDGALSALTPDAFAQEILVDGLGAAHVTVGADFRFGKARAGNADILSQLGREMGFGVTIAELLTDDGTNVSSTRIRQALQSGEPRKAAEMLGHLHRIEGPVIQGDQRGRDLGYPTANMALEGLLLPKLGVYAVQVEILDGPFEGICPGVASLGTRPMFGDNVPNLETFLFDFSGDLYGTPLSVGLVEYLRPELKFDGLAALIAQMDADSAQARAILGA